MGADADLKAAFDRIDHDRLLESLGTFPARDQIAAWLRAGVIDQGWFTPTERGTPQGGVVSPVLLNVALHGLETAAGVRYRRCGSDAANAKPGAPVLVRYADDLVALYVIPESRRSRRGLLTGLRPGVLCWRALLGRAHLAAL